MRKTFFLSNASKEDRDHKAKSSKEHPPANTIGREIKKLRFWLPSTD